MTALMEKIQEQHRMTASEAEGEYAKLVIAAASDETKFSADHAEQILSQCGKTLSDLQKDAEHCKLRSEQVAATKEGQAAKLKHATCEDQINEINRKMDALLAPLEKEKQEVAGRLQALSQKMVYGGNSENRLRDKPPVWIQEKRQELAAELRKIQPRIDYLAKSQSTLGNQIGEWVDRLKELVSLLAIPLQRGDLEAKKTHERRQQEKKNLESELKGAESRKESDSREYRRLRSEANKLRAAQDRLSELAITKAWPVPADFQD